jgi:hypothetical protein
MKGTISYYWALWRTGKLPPERIPDVACDALQEGMDNALLRQLAGLVRPTRRDIGTKFDDACQQLGIIPDTEEYLAAEFKAWLQTALPVAHTLARKILERTIDPVQGWLNIPWRNDQPLGPIGIFFEFSDPAGMVSFDDEFHKHLFSACEKFLQELEPKA